MNILQTNDIAIHWREGGDPGGAPVVFANSLGTDLRLWDALLPLLPQGLRLIRYDLRGHGLTSCPEAPYDMDTLVGDAEALVRELVDGPCVFVGLSIGGMIGQGLAARGNVPLRGLVLSNTAARLGTPEAWRARIDAIRAGGLDAITDAVMERWFAPRFLAGPELPLWRNMMLRQPAAGYMGCCHAIAGADLTESTRALTLPVLGIAGAQDGASPPELVKATIDTIAGARFSVIDGTGHLPCVEVPQGYARLLTEFLTEIGHV